MLPLQWYPELHHHCPKVPIVLLGTKLDLRNDKETLDKFEESNESPITYIEGLEMADNIKAFNYLACSALPQEHVNNVFDCVIQAALCHPRKVKKKRSCLML